MDEIMDQLNQVIEERVLELKRKSEEDKVPAYCTETKEHVLRTDRILNSLQRMTGNGWMTSLWLKWIYRNRSV